MPLEETRRKRVEKPNGKVRGELEVGGGEGEEAATSVVVVVVGGRGTLSAVGKGMKRGGLQCKRGEGGSPRIRVTNARVCTPPRHPPRPPKEVNAVGRHFATRSDAIQMRRMRVAGAAPLPSAR